MFCNWNRAVEQIFYFPPYAQVWGFLLELKLLPSETFIPLTLLETVGLLLKVIATFRTFRTRTPYVRRVIGCYQTSQPLCVGWAYIPPRCYLLAVLICMSLIFCDTASFHVCLGISDILFHERSALTPCPFSVEVFVFFKLVCSSSLYILSTNPSMLLRIAKTFSQPVACLLTFLQITWQEDEPLSEEGQVCESNYLVLLLVQSPIK